MIIKLLPGKRKPIPTTMSTVEFQVCIDLMFQPDGLKMTLDHKSSLKNETRGKDAKGGHTVTVSSL